MRHFDVYCFRSLTRIAVYSLLTLITRVLLKRGTFGVDDALVTAATIIQCGEAAAVFLALKRGAGTAFTIVSSSNLSSSSEAVYSADILFIVSLALAKASVICLLMRIFNLAYSRACHSPRFLFYRHVCLSALGVTAIWAVGSIVGFSVNCNAATFLNDQQSCPAQTTRWAVIMGVDAFLEALLVAMTIINVLPLQLSTMMKGQIILSFAFRLPCILLSVLHFHYVQKYSDSSNDGLEIVTVLNIMQIYLCWSLVSATIPTLKAFVKSFNSGFGLGVDVATAYFGTAPHSVARHEYELSKVKSAQQSQQNSHSRSVHVPEPENKADGLRERGQPLSGSSFESTSHGHDRQQSITSRGSQEHIIRKDVRWTVEYNDH